MKVIIAIAINEDGDYYAWGSSEHDKEDVRREVEGNVTDPHIIHYIEADIPLPEPETFKGVINNEF